MIDIVLNEEAINKICPFYFLLDKDYRFIQFGRSFKIVFSQIIEGSNLYDHFSLKSSVHSILTEVVDLHSLFIMVSKDLGLEMKMIGIEIAKDKKLYVGYPILNDSDNSLKKYGLSIEDLPQHDSLIEFLFLMEGMKRSMAEAQDYSEKEKDKRKELQEREFLLHEAMELAKMGIWYFNFNEIKLVFSSGCCDIYGLHNNNNRHSYEEWLAMIHPDYQDFVKNKIEVSKEDLSPVSITARIIKADGTSAFVSQKIIYKFNKEGKPIGLYGIVQDITEQKLAEEQINASEKRFRALVENSKEVIAVSNKDRDIIYVSPALEFILGYKEDEITGKKYKLYYHEDDQKKVEDSLRELMGDKTGTYRRLDVRMKHKDGSWKWVELTATKQFENPAINGIVKNFHDISDIKLAQSKLEEINNSLDLKIAVRTKELKAKNDDLETFVYTVSHDLRSPLRLINSFATMLIEGKGYPNDPERSMEFLKIISQYTIRMNSIISDLLNLSKLSKLEIQKKRVDVKALAEVISAEYLKQENYKKADVKIMDMPTVMADPGLLRQALENLISNALKYSSKNENPQITIGTEFDESSSSSFFVADNGAGFDESFAERLFKPFQRGHSTEEFEGTGIGLSIVKSIIEKHGGDIWAKSDLGKGTKFNFTLEVVAA
ncbi:MAG: PAS domain S-box protein [Bacteroidetes bacterium]|nr:PAS domain S-box protein [Bacteroidota bacterium]